MNRFFPCLVLALSACGADTDLHPVCASTGSPCLIDEQGAVHIAGEMPESRCTLGTLTCDEGEAVCEGYQWDPVPEQCNGIDDDCNGLVDEGTGGDRCEGDGLGVCARAVETCVDGELQCMPLAAPSPEKCNGLDDDCNGLVDDVEPELYWPDDAPPLSEVSLGPDSQCALGLRRCVEGEYIVEGLVLPSVEMCDDVDNDCNGAIDDTTDEDRSAVVLVLDYSGSMNSYLPSLVEAVCDWNVGEADRFGVVAVGVEGDQWDTDERPSASAYRSIEIGPDFVKHPMLCHYLRSSPWEGRQGQTEHQPAGVVAAGGFDWPEGYRRSVVVVSDEEAQFQPVTTETRMINACAENQMAVNVFTSHADSWGDTLEACQGRAYPLAMDFDHLRAAFRGCRE